VPNRVYTFLASVMAVASAQITISSERNDPTRGMSHGKDDTIRNGGTPRQGRNDLNALRSELSQRAAS